LMIRVLFCTRNKKVWHNCHIFFIKSLSSGNRESPLYLM
jgi:hypothetical protein